MNLRPLLLLVMLPFAACVSSGGRPPGTLEEISWSDAGETANSELLTLRRDHTYRITDPRQQRKPNDTIQAGSYDVLSREYGVILLDNRTPLRLSHVNSDAGAYRFTTFTFTPSALVPPDQRDQYVRIVDQYFVPKAFLELHAGETPVSGWLP